MTAKEMFKELGYKLVAENDYYIKYRKEAPVTYEIYFNKEYENIEILPTVYGRVYYFFRIDKDLLRAINQQSKELFWLD